MSTAGAQDAFENSESDALAGGQFLPPAIDEGCDGSAAEQGPDGGIARLREDLRTLTDDVAAIDRRDAAQHGVLKGEIAHLVRRVARLEAIPRPRPGR